MIIIACRTVFTVGLLKCPKELDRSNVCVGIRTMAICSNCGRNLPDSASFCSRCGVSQKGVHCPMPASGIVYLFADRFVDETRFGEKVPCKDKRVLYEELADILMVASFMWLEEKGLVTMEMRRIREEYRPFGILGKRSKLVDRPFIKKEMPSRTNPEVAYAISYRGRRGSSIEAHIWNQMSRGASFPYNVTYKVIGGDFSKPEGQIIGIAKDYLLDEGYFLRKKKWMVLRERVPDCTKISELEKHADKTMSMISRFKEKKPRVYKHLLDEVGKAYRNRVKKIADYDAGRFD